MKFIFAENSTYFSFFKIVYELRMKLKPFNIKKSQEYLKKN